MARKTKGSGKRQSLFEQMCKVANRHTRAGSKVTRKAMRPSACVTLQADDDVCNSVLQSIQKKQDRLTARF